MSADPASIMPTLLPAKVVKFETIIGETWKKALPAARRRRAGTAARNRRAIVRARMSQWAQQHLALWSEGLVDTLTDEVCRLPLPQSGRQRLKAA